MASRPTSVIERRRRRSSPSIILTRIGQDDGGFFIPASAIQVKDFIDETYQASSSDFSSSVSHMLYSTVTNFINEFHAETDKYPYDGPELPNPSLHHTQPGTMRFLIWPQPLAYEAESYYYHKKKAFLREFRPCVDAAAKLFKAFRTVEYENMMALHDQQIRNFPKVVYRYGPLVSGSGGQVIEQRVLSWDDDYRCPFESMRISVNTTSPPAPLSSTHKLAWAAVVLLGGFVGGEVSFMGGGEHMVENVESQSGDTWVIKGDCIFGGENFVGERIQVEFFVPVINNED